MNRLLFALLIAMSGAAVIWGFVTVGGPETARMEKRDATRFSDLRRLGEHYRCAEYFLSPGAEAISPTYCNNRASTPPDLRDPVTQAPYSYTRRGADAFEVCATFEVATVATPAGRRQGFDFDGSEGCLGYVRAGPDANWRLR